jgi:prolyl 4-hydroxylase
MMSCLERLRLCEDNLLVRDDFLAPAACSRLLSELSRCEWKPSEAALVSPHGHYRQGSVPARTSLTVAAGKWPPRVEAILRRIEQLLEKQIGIVIGRLEEWQATRYKKGEKFDFHLDCGCWHKHPAGERRRTILIYLDHPLEGGSTFFRALNREISPVAGRIVVWNNLLPNGNCNHAMVHAGLPVIRGAKTILTTWERQRKYTRSH